MAVSFALRTANGSTTDQATPYTTAAFSTAAGSVVFASISIARNDSIDPTAPTVTRDGVTYTLVHADPLALIGGSARRRAFLYIGHHPSTVTDVALSIDPDQVGEAVLSSITWVVSEATGVDTASPVHATNNAYAVFDANHATASSQTPSVALPSPVDAGNVSYAQLVSASTEAVAADTNWVAIGEALQPFVNLHTQAQWDADGEQTADWAFPTTAWDCAASVFEVRAPAAADVLDVTRQVHAQVG